MNNNADTGAERLASRYEHHHGTSRPPGFIYGGDDRAQVVASLVGTSNMVLDLGCRDGSLAATFDDSNTITGVDIDRNALRLASEKGIQTHWADLSATLPFPEETFDVVVLSEVLEHLPDPEFTIREVRRVLRDNGRLVGSVPNAFRIKNRLLFTIGRDFETDPTHLHWYSPSAMERVLMNGGFRAVNLQFGVGRFARLSPRLFGNSMFFEARA